MTRAPLVEKERIGRVLRLTLNRPERSNSLVPDLLEDLSEALAGANPNTESVIVLRAAGHAFSTGGDIGGFLAHEGADLLTYADGLIGLLNKVVLQMLSAPAPIIVQVQGAVTGGSAGLVFAADIAFFSENAFLAPYYVEVGFAPDGGWTALLPDLIGRRRAGEIQFNNRRVEAQEALALGLCDRVCPAPDLKTEVWRCAEEICAKSDASVRATKRLLLTPQRRALIAEGLDRERQAFLDNLASGDTLSRMRRFVSK